MLSVLFLFTDSDYLPLVSSNSSYNTKYTLYFQVYSGYRFVAAAHEQKKHIAIVNIGKTRADNLASIKISGKCSNILKNIQINC